MVRPGTLDEYLDPLGVLGGPRLVQSIVLSGAAKLASRSGALATLLTTINYPGPSSIKRTLRTGILPASTPGQQVVLQENGKLISMA